MSCVSDGVVRHSFPKIVHRGTKYLKRFCEKCGYSKNLFRARKSCVVCVVGDDSGLGLKCNKLRNCKRPIVIAKKRRVSKEGVSGIKGQKLEGGGLEMGRGG